MKINPIKECLKQKGFKEFDNKIFVVSDKMLLDAIKTIKKEREEKKMISCFKCDWCGGELEPFPQAKSGLRCKNCWRVEGKKKPVFWKRYGEKCEGEIND